MMASEPNATASTAPPAADSGLLSPNAMAQAVLDSAMADRDRQAEHASNNQSTETLQSNKRPRHSHDLDAKDTKEKLKQVWEGTDKEEAMEETLSLVHGQIESLIRSGLEAYHGWESAKRDLSQAKEECDAKDRELRRLRASEEQSRVTITVSIVLCLVICATL